MLLSNGEIWQARDALKELVVKPWPVKTAYWLARLSRRLSEPAADIEQVKNMLIIKYGQSDANGRTEIRPGSDSWETFVKEFNELMATETEVDFAPVQLPVQLPDSDITITPATLMALDAFVEVA